jgi:hypothetical protein
VGHGSRQVMVIYRFRLGVAQSSQSTCSGNKGSLERSQPPRPFLERQESVVSSVGTLLTQKASIRVSMCGKQLAPKGR